MDDLTKETSVVELMKSSNSEADWNKNTDKVIIANRGRYPDFWYDAVEKTMLYDQCKKNFNK